MRHDVRHPAGPKVFGKLLEEHPLEEPGRTTGLLDIIVEMTNGKCRVSLDVAAPIQIAMHTSFSAMMTSTPANRKATAKAPYTSPRAARKITLSRRPARASSATTAAICQVGSRPTVVPSSGMGPVPSENNATRIIRINAAYNTMSTGPRLSPLVSGTRLGQGGRRIVLGRNQ